MRPQLAHSNDIVHLTTSGPMLETIAARLNSSDQFVVIDESTRMHPFSDCKRRVDVDGDLEWARVKRYEVVVGSVKVTNDPAQELRDAIGEPARETARRGRLFLQYDHVYHTSGEMSRTFEVTTVVYVGNVSAR